MYHLFGIEEKSMHDHHLLLIMCCRNDVLFHLRTYNMHLAVQVAHACAIRVHAYIL